MKSLSVKKAEDDFTEWRAAVILGLEFGTVTRAVFWGGGGRRGARRESLCTHHIWVQFRRSYVGTDQASADAGAEGQDEFRPACVGETQEHLGRQSIRCFGESDIEWNFNDSGGIVADVYDPKVGERYASGMHDIAAWFVDTDYSEEGLFVRCAHFVGTSHTCKSLETNMKAENDKETCETPYGDSLRPFSRPSKCRFAVKVVNHFGVEIQ